MNAQEQKRIDTISLEHCLEKAIASLEALEIETGLFYINRVMELGPTNVQPFIM